MTGLIGREPPGDPGELARVAHRLEVEADGVGLVVVDPVLHEVVAGDVDPVAGGGEDRDAEAAPGGRGEHRDAERAALREEAEPAGRRQLGRQRGVEPHLGVVVDEPEASWGRRRASRRRGPRRSSCSCSSVPSAPASAKPGRDHEQGLDPGLARTRRRRRAPGRPGTATTARSTGPGIVGDRRRRPCRPCTSMRLAVDGVDRRRGSRPRGCWRARWCRWSRCAPARPDDGDRCGEAGPAHADAPRRGARGTAARPWTARSARCRTRPRRRRPRCGG